MRIVVVLFSIWFSLFGSTAAWGATFPEKPVKILVGFTAGGGTDALARILAQKLSEKWSQSVVVENRPGADGDIALEALMRAAPDGHTLVFASNALTIAPSQRKVSYDPVKTFAPVTQAAYSPGVLVVNPSLPVNNLKELIAYAKARPGELNFGSTGVGTTPYLQMALLMKLTGTQMVSVPFKGNPVAALLRGDIQLNFTAIPAILSHLKAGKVKALAVSTRKRAAQLPDVPTVEEAAGLPGYEAFTWYGVLATGGTPKDIVNKLYTDFASVMKEPATSARIAKMGFVSIVSTPDELRATLKSDSAKWADLMKTIKVVK